MLRDPDGSFYVRQEGAGLLVGPFERDTRPWDVQDGFHARLLPPDLDRLETRTRGRSRAHARLRHRRHQDGRQRPRRLHARRPLPDGARAGSARLPRARRLQHLRHRLRGRRRALRSRVDRRRPAERQHVGARRPPLRRVRAVAVVPRPAGDRRLRTRVRDPLPGGGARRRTAGQAGRPARRAVRARCRDGRSASAGSGRCGSRRGGDRDEYSMRRGNWHEAVGEECLAVRSAVGRARPDELREVQRLGPGRARRSSTGSARTACRRSGESR